MTSAAASLPFGILKRKRCWIPLLYVLLLAISHGVRSLTPDPAPAPKGWHDVILAAEDAGGAQGAPVRIRYLDSAPHAPPDRPVIVLVHGSPLAASKVFPNHVAALAAFGRVLAPDLPGFGYSTRRVADYGFEAHADYLRRFVARLGIRHFHLVAYSMGGGAALHLAAALPARVASLTMISAIGVQEFELLGDYHLNRSLHAVQLLGLFLLQEATPHMGLLDRQPFNRYYARNFFDADQRPLRAILRHLPMPVMIWHGRDDWLVPLAAAREHYRLVPHSELQVHPGGHLLVLERPKLAMADVGGFVARVEAGDARWRIDASSVRAAAARQPLDRIDRPPAASFWEFMCC